MVRFTDIVPFPSTVQIENHPITGRPQWQLQEDLEIRLRKGAHPLLVIPKKFVTDYASIPNALTPIFPPTSSEYSLASLTHDYLYCSKEVSRFLADALFRELMALQGTAWWKRVVMYYAVRFGGRSAWKRAKL